MFDMNVCDRRVGIFGSNTSLVSNTIIERRSWPATEVETKCISSIVSTRSERANLNFRQTPLVLGKTILAKSFWEIAIRNPRVFFESSESTENVRKNINPEAR